MPHANGAVLFAPTDYASFGRRAASCIIDLVAILLIMAALQAYFMYSYVPVSVRTMPRSPAQQKLIDEHIRPHARGLMLLRIGLIVIYLVPIRRLPGGTLGYRAAGIRLVGATGQPPDWWPLIKRHIFLGALAMLCFMPAGLFITGGRVSNQNIQFLIILGCVIGAILLAYSSCTTRPRRQALHDRWSGTWMIRKNAQPTGPALPIYRIVLLGTFPIRYLDLEPAPSDTAQTFPIPLPIGQIHPISAQAR